MNAAACAVGVSRRYVQQLLEETGKSFTDHVAERRLAHAYALLTDPRCRHLTVTHIAYDAGFSDISHFNRVFRRRYGDTPSSIRAAVSPRN